MLELYVTITCFAIAMFFERLATQQEHFAEHIATKSRNKMRPQNAK